MQIRIDTQLKTLKGEPLNRGNGQPDDFITLGEVAAEALVAPTENNQKLSGEDKLKCYSLAMRITMSEAGICELTADDIRIIKETICTAWPPLVSGQAWSMLENAKTID